MRSEHITRTPGVTDPPLGPEACGGSGPEALIRLEDRAALTVGNLRNLMKRWRVVR